MASDLTETSYHAFISYSHRDKGWGEWLHKGLEHYRVPKPLVGRPTSRGEPVPARIYPVFRDREELPTAVDLGEIISRALAQSRYLIVICSPASARSMWVNQEILEFKRLGGENRVLAIIVDGEPNAGAGKPGFTADLECFPEALRFKLGTDGMLSKVPTEPIAADARAHGDGKNDALLKLAAGVLGVGFAELKRRDEIQRRRRHRIAITLISCVAIIVSGLAVIALFQRSVALEQKQIAINHAAEAMRQRNEAVTQRKEAQFNMAQAELALGRHWLETGEPRRALKAVLQALDGADAAGRELDAGWPVLRRAMEASPVEFELQAHSGGIASISFDRSGQRLLTMSEETEEFALWSVQDGSLLIRIPCKGVSLAAWTSGDREVVTLEGNPTSELCWRDAATGAILRRKTLPEFIGDIERDVSDTEPEWIAVTRFTNDGAQSVLIRLEDGFADWSIPVKEGSIGRTRFVPGNEIALRIQSDTGVSVISLKNGKEIAKLEGVDANSELDLSCLVTSMDHAAMAAVILHNDEPVSAGVWRLSDGRRLVEFQIGDASPLDFWFHPTTDGRLAGKLAPLVSAISEPLSRIPVTVNSPGPLVAWRQGTPESGSVALASLSMCRLVSPKAILLYPETGLEREISGFGDGLTDLAVAKDGSRMAVSGKDGSIGVLQLTNTPVTHEKALPPGVKVLAVAENAGQLLLKTAQGMIVWDVEGRKITSTIQPAPQDETATVDRDKGGASFVWGSDDVRYYWNAAEEWLAISRIAEDEAETGSILFYHTGTGAFLGEYLLKTRHPEIVLAPRGHRAVVRTGLFSADLLVVKDGAVQAFALPFSGNNPPVASFSSDGEKVYLSARPGWLEIYSTTTCRPESRIKLADDEPGSPMFTSLVVHPKGGEMLAGTLAQWFQVDLRNTTSTQIEADFDPVSTHAFIGDGRFLMSSVGSRLQWRDWPSMEPLGDVENSFDLSACLELPGADLLLLRNYPSSMSWSSSVVETKEGNIRMSLNNVVGVSPQLGLAAVQETESFRIIRLNDGEILVELPALRVEQACFAADGSRVGLVLTDKRYVSLPLAEDRNRLLEMGRRRVRTF